MSSLYYDPFLYEALGIQIFVPDPEQVKASYDLGICTEFPYWSRVWPSALALSSWLNANVALISGKNLLEVGAGVGLPSFVAAKHALSVTISDHIPLAVKWISFNIERLKLMNASSLLFNWESSARPPADLVLMSDVGYREEDFELVHAMIRDYIDVGTGVILAVPARLISAKFIAPLENHVVKKDLIKVAETVILILALATDFPLPVQKTST